MSLIADIVVTSATAAFAHFGFTLDVPDREPPQVERTVARTPVKKPEPEPVVAKPAKAVDDCPDKTAQLHRA